ncbi:hypothetical protein BCR37DRAFT_411864 [Protomyces lactucae-debilis]|uniref:Adenylate cyclase n=1 Tax=Protomyces lactucae-debilis TaxID=2754530 RepID=A0A1Y2FSZ0_PROLT|nr:uncharacterized protein BCR37DRAFT_411864 [Protomyces lactucae-debilis]ORY87120.1 hypothetical protein BCR37DRAFT_411864 [Protomyces lactucae-debilis]
MQSTQPLEGDALRIEKLQKVLSQVQANPSATYFNSSFASARGGLQNKSLFNGESRPSTADSSGRASAHGLSGSRSPPSPSTIGSDAKRNLSLAISPHSEDPNPFIAGPSKQAAPIPPPLRSPQSVAVQGQQERRDSVFRLFRPSSRDDVQQQQPPSPLPVAAPEVVSPFLYQGKQIGYNSALDSPSLELPNPFSLRAPFLQPLNPIPGSPPMSDRVGMSNIAPSSAPVSIKERRKESKGFFNNLLNKRKKQSSAKEERQTRQESVSQASIAEPQFSSPFAGESATPRSKRSSLRLPPMRRQTIDRLSSSGRNSGVSPNTSSRTSRANAITPGDPNELVLDTDLSQLSGIVDVEKAPPSKRPSKDFTISKEVAPFSEPPEDEEANWAPPESWAVRRPEDIARDDGLLDEYDPLDDSHPTAASNEEVGKQPSQSDKRGVPHHQMRLYRGDWTFATVSCPLNTTTEALMSIIGRKFFLTSVANHQILLQRNGLSRILQAWEKPFLLQKQLLEQAGYTPNDRVEEIGREDNSYLCRFIFKTISAPSFSVDADTDAGNTEHFDLSGRNVQTIPIVLYKYASRIRSLDLSRNLSLDIPIDFIQSCPNLQSIVWTHNESPKLQGNVMAASSLVLLDVSFNKMTELDSRIHQLTNLLSFIARSNRLMSLPSTLGRLINIRRVNLSFNHFTEFPIELCDLYHLEDLDISFNRLERLPKEIGHLSRLQRLLVNNNYLSGSLPGSFAQLVSLREVDLRFNQLTTLEILASCPLLESISAGHNAITVVDSKFPAARLFHLNKCPVTKFSMSTNAMTLTSLDLSNAKLPMIPDAMFDNFTNLIKLVLDNNHFTYFPPQLGNLTRLQHLSCTGNQLTELPSEIGKLCDLRVLDLHSNNLKSLPGEVWLLGGLISLNASSNLLKAFPDPPANVKPASEVPTNGSTLLTVVEEAEDSPRKNSQASLTTRGLNAMAQSLKYLFLGDNRLDDDCFSAITLLQGLRVLNLSFNDIYEVPTSGLRRLHHLVELYLSGNELTSLPSDDLEVMQTLRVLHVNANKLQSLPAEIGKIRRLMVLDVGSNNLKYNTANWPYDWNWNWNLDLKYLNLSGNKRLEIKPSNNTTIRDRNLSDFGALNKLRVLGLMDLTLTIDSVPEESEDRRVRLSGSDISNMSYGQADTLGRNEHLSIIDMVIPRFQGQESEIIFGMFDGSPIAHGGSKIAKHLQDFFTEHLALELKKLRKDEQVPDALRRAFLSFNKELGTAVTPLPVKTGSLSQETPLMHPLPSPSFQRPSMVSLSSAMQVTSYISSALSSQDRTAGASVCLVYMIGKKAYVANVGDTLAVLSRSDGEASLLSVKHNAGDASEVERIREAGGYVSRDGLVNDQSDVTRSMGYFHLTPFVQAAPHVAEVELTEQDEFIIIASKYLWDVMTLQTAVDIARSEREDLMLAAQKLRDFAISYGVQEKLSIMIIGVGDLFHRKAKMAKQLRNASAARAATGGFLVADEDLILGHTTKSRRRAAADQPADSTLARLTREVAPPVGELAMIFTDIKNSTLLWESHPVAMRSAIKIHNSIMRRQLRSIGGYEVKTEGDAFMVCFSTVTSALLWCFTVQTQLLTADWPQEILDSRDGAEIFDEESGHLLFRGLSVRMGIHWGAPVCEVDPITRRMDYFGPIVNRAARISSIADGGQITVSSDVVRDLELLEQAHRQRMDHGTAGLEEEEEVFGDELTMLTVKKDMQMLKRIGFEVVPLGERKLKGLENAEFVSLAYPSSLKGRLHHVEKLEVKQDPSQRVLNHENIIDVYTVVFRLESLCSIIRGNKPRHENRVNVLRGKIVKAYSAEDDDVRLAAVLENLLTRVENALAALTLHYSKSVSASLEEVAMLPFDEVMLALQEYKVRTYDLPTGLGPATVKEEDEEDAQ